MTEKTTRERAHATPTLKTLFNFLQFPRPTVVEAEVGWASAHPHSPVPTSVLLRIVSYCCDGHLCLIIPKSARQSELARSVVVVRNRSDEQMTENLGP